MEYKELEGTAPKNIYVREIEGGVFEILGWIGKGESSEKQKFGTCVNKNAYVETFKEAIMSISNSMWREEMGVAQVSEVPNYPIFWVK